MSFLNLPWQFDKHEFPESVKAFVHYKRWRRGPITFYKKMELLTQDQEWTTEWWVYVANDFGFGIQLPNKKEKKD